MCMETAPVPKEDATVHGISGPGKKKGNATTAPQIRGSFSSETFDLRDELMGTSRKPTSY